jgi:predicted TIM-barrel fold metal-dependent hydrolase
VSTSTQQTTDPDWLISVDDHLFESPNLWLDRASAADRDRVPRVIEEDGKSYWVYDAKKVPIPGTLAHAGRPKAEVSADGMSYTTMRPEYYDSKARVADMNRDGVLASLCFPYFPRYCGQTFYEAADHDLALKCVVAYNDWVIDEWAGSVPGRFLPLVIVPLWDPTQAAKEIERTAGKGAKAVSFSEDPSKLGLPSIHDRTGYWDPVFRAANDAGLPLAIHFGSSSTTPQTSADAPRLVSGTLSPISLAYCFTDWIWSGLLPRFENLKILMSEGGIGWLPYMIERCENVIRDHARDGEGRLRDDFAVTRSLTDDNPDARFDEPPAELFRKHIYGCFIDDEYGCRHLEEVGVDNVMIETDYPHGDGTYPDSRENARRLLDGHGDEVKAKVLQGNARKLFGLSYEDFPVPSVDVAAVTAVTA